MVELFTNFTKKKILIFGFTFILLVPFSALTTITNPLFAQSQNNTIFPQTSQIQNDTITPNLGSQELLKQILSASSFDNIQVISWIDGITVSGVDFSEDVVSLTLKRIESGNDVNNSLPVTVTVVRVPGSSIKDLLTLVEASSKLRGINSTGPMAGILMQKGGLLGPGGQDTADSTPLQALMQLGRSTQMGVVNIVGGNWDAPRKVTTGLLDLDSLFGMESTPSSDARAHFMMIFVVPYVGKTNFGTVPLE
jgi:hypothetical protein